MRHEVVDELQRRLRELPAPEAPSHLLAKILKSRSAGPRVKLPRLRRTPAPWLIGALAAAAVLALVMNPRSHEPLAMFNESDYRDIANALAIWPPEALAQEAASHRPPSYRLVRDLRGASVQGGRWTYRICRDFDDDVLTAQSKCRERLTVSVTKAAWGGRPAWLVAQQGSWRGDARNHWDTTVTRRSPIDTTYVDVETLRPFYYTIVGDRFRLVHRFTWDTVHEALDIGGAHPRSWRVHAEIPGAVDAPLVLRWRWFNVALLFQALPLDPSWRASVYFVGLVSRNPSKAQIDPLDLRVARSERVEVPAGTFDCWKVVARERNDVSITFWASKAGGWLVKMEERGPDWRSERTLVAASLPAP